MIEAVIFDWAGTTIDYGSLAPVKGFVDAFAKYGVAITGAEARAPMGLLKIDHTRAISDTPRVREEFIRQNGRAAAEEDIQAIYADFEQTLMENIGAHTDIKDHVIDTVAELRKRGIKIGSTTGYTRKMMETILPLSAAKGYAPDYTAAPDEVPKGRPHPYMIWRNMTELAVSNPRHVVKVGDTAADIKEGLNANTWTVAVLAGSNEMGLTREEAASLAPPEWEEHKRRARKVFYQAGADYIIDDMDELMGVIDDINRRLAREKQRLLMTPGPLTTKASVKNAMLTDHCTWSDEYKQLTAGLCDEITKISADENYATVLFQGSGSYAVESMINSLCAPDRKILFLVNGEYGKRMLRIADMAGKSFDAIHFDPCTPVDTAALEERLKTDNAIHAVVFAHCETTTGVLNLLEDTVRTAKRYGKSVLVDAMSSFAAYDIDMPGLDIDALAASANKCLEGLPGLSFVVVKKSLLDNGKSYANSHCLDLFDQYNGLYAGGGKFRFTSPTNILLALEQAIREYHKEGGLAARAVRYQENHAILIEGLAKAGIEALVKSEDQSYIITTFDLGNLDFQKLYGALKEKGFIIYPGKLTDVPTFRIGNIGDVYPSDMMRLVEAVRGAIEE
ncbi:MAG: 2-aminoethylphosphonate--pyruvate transaminase [Oscillospiraceae bacterium]|nr:2-aminoethylphosphonate--pyruvate transaminase [Oscillospiraceae bacterium]